MHTIQYEKSVQIFKGRTFSPVIDKMSYHIQCKIKSYPITSQCIRIKPYPWTIEEGNLYLLRRCRALHCHYETANFAKVTLALSEWLYSWIYVKLPCLTVFDLQLWQFHMVQPNRSRPPFFPSWSKSFLFTVFMFI